MIKLTNILNEIKEDINPSEAYGNVGSVQTLVDGKRKVAMIALNGQSNAAETIKIINDNGLKKIGIDQRPGDEVYIVYVPGAEADAKELHNILNRYGGYASYKASYEDTKRIGELLGYKKETIDTFLKKNYDADGQPIQENITEVNWKQALAGAGITLMSLGTPKEAQAQNFQGLKDKIKQGVTAVQNKINPQQKVDTIKVQKDTPLQLAKFKDYKGAGYGYAKSPDEATAYKIAKNNAKTDLIKKIGQQQMTAGIEEKAVKYYQMPDGSYECEVLVVIGNM
jgi:hypothetical protein